MENAYVPAPRRLLIISLLALIGLGLAGYLTWEFHVARASQGFTAACDVSAAVSCTEVARTHYAEFLPNLPLATLAGMFFAAVLAVAALARRAAFARAGARALQLLGLLGLVTSLGYLYVMHFRIGKYCLFCLGVDAVNLAFFLVAAGLKPGWRGGDGGAPWRRIVLSGAFAAAAAWGGLSLLKSPAGGAPATVPSAPTMASAPVSPEPVTPAAGGPLLTEADLPPGLLPPDLKPEIRKQALEAINHAISGPVEAVGAGPEFPSEGPQAAAVTIVEFADFQCPHCAHAFADFKLLRAKYGDAVRIVYRQYPLSKRCNPLLKDWDAQRKSDAARPEDFHAFACEEARLALCAGDQGRYAEAAEALYGGIEGIEKKGPKELLAARGFDAAKLDACQRDPKSAARVVADAEEGFKLGLHGTPGLFVNGRQMEAPPQLLDFVVGRILSGGTAAH